MISAVTGRRITERRCLLCNNPYYFVCVKCANAKHFTSPKQAKRRFKPVTNILLILNHIFYYCIINLGVILLQTNTGKQISFFNTKEKTRNLCSSVIKVTAFKAKSLIERTKDCKYIQYFVLLKRNIFENRIITFLKMDTLEESSSKSMTFISEENKSSIAGKIISNILGKITKTKKASEDIAIISDQVSFETLKEVDRKLSCCSSVKSVYSQDKTAMDISTKHSRNIFKKIIGRKNNNLALKSSSQPSTARKSSIHEMCNSGVQTLATQSEEMNITHYSFEDAAQSIDNKTNKVDVTKNIQYLPVATSYIKSAESINSLLVNSLSEINDFSEHLKEQEMHLIQVLSKYVQNQSFQKELIEVLTCYAKVHIEAERRAHKLANEMWLQQADVSRAQEHALQESLNAIVKQNRELLEDNESLMKKNEQLSIKYDSYCNRGHLGCSNQVIENLNKSNDALRSKVSSFLYKMDDLEKELHVLQSRNSVLELNLRNSNGQIQNYKAIVQRMTADYELGQAHFNHEMSMSQSILKEATEAGDILLDDLNSLKNQFKSMSMAVNWTKFKTRGKTLPDLIHICRSCINELSKDLISATSSISLKDKDLEKLSANLQGQVEKINQLTVEKSELFVELEKLKEAHYNMEKMLEKNSEYENERHNYENTIKNITEELETQKFQLNVSAEEIGKLNVKLCEKENRLLEVQNRIGEYMSEINTLEIKINSLNKVLHESGVGNMLSEITNMQEKLEYLQAEYFQVIMDKKVLEEQLTVNVSEKETLEKSSKSYLECIKTLENDINNANKNNTNLKEELEKEKSTVLALQNERIKHLEEKNKVYQKINEDVSKIENLEGIIEQMNKDTANLNSIADYNKQVSMQLQVEISKRDKTIRNLEKSVEELNNSQQMFLKDKDSLYKELQQLRQIKEQLSQKLSEEIQKSEKNTDYKNEVGILWEEIKVMHEMLKTERVVLKQLLENFETVANQRNLLLVDRDNNLEEIKLLKLFLEKERNQQICLSEEIAKCKESLHMKHDLFIEKEEKLMAYQKQIEEHCESLQTEIDNLRVTVNELQKENGILLENIEYLKNNTQKLNNDLHLTRDENVHLQKTLNNEIKNKEDIMVEFYQNRDTVMSLNKEKNQLLEQIYSLQAENAKMSIEYQEAINESQNSKKERNNEMQTLREVINNNNVEIKKLVDAVNQYKQTIDEMRKKNEYLKEENLKLSSTINQSTNKSQSMQDFKAERQRYQDELNEMYMIKQRQENTIKALQKDIEVLKNKLDIAQKEIQRQNEIYAKCVDEIETEYNCQKVDMKNDLQSLSSKLVNLKNDLTLKEKAYSQIESAHKDLATKLLNSVKICIDEKCGRQTAECKVNDLIKELENVKLENERLTKEINKLQVETRCTDTQIHEIQGENEHINNKYKKLQSKYDNILGQINDYEAQIKDLNEKCSRLSKIAGDNTRSIEGTTAYKGLQEKILDYEKKIEILREGMDDNNDTVVALQEELTNLKSNYSILEFQKCEAVLRLHEIMGKLTSEENLNLHLKDVHQRILATIVELQEKGLLNQQIYDYLLPIIMCT